MTILWCGGEEVDFPSGGPVSISNYYRSAYSRCGMYFNGSNSLKSSQISSQLTSCWISCCAYAAPLYASAKGVLTFGVCLYGYGVEKGLYVGVDNVTSLKIALYKFDTGTATKIASEAGTSLTSGANLLHMQVIDYGASATVNIYREGVLVLTYTGDVTVSGMTYFNCVGSRAGHFDVSEFILADEDTRLMGLKTIAPSAAGDTSANWTGAYTDIDETSLPDSDKIYSATNNADFQCNLTGMPTGTWSVKAVKIAARCVDGSGSTGIQLGVKSGGTVESGDTQEASGYWQTKERLMQVNPVTGVAFTPAEIEALQINLRAKAL